MLSAVRPTNGVHAEQTIAPDLHRPPAGALGERLKALARVFVAVLGMNGLAETEINRLAVHAHFLPLEAGKMHLDAVAVAVVASVMLERRHVQIDAEFSMDPS